MTSHKIIDQRTGRCQESKTSVTWWDPVRFHRENVTAFETGSATFFCKEPDGKYCRLCRQDGLPPTTPLCHCSTKHPIDNTEMNGCVCAPQNFIYRNRLWAALGPLAIVCQPRNLE